MQFTVCKVPNDALALYNTVIFNPADYGRLFAGSKFRHHPIALLNRSFTLGCRHDDGVAEGQIGLSMVLRQWMQVSLGQGVHVDQVGEVASSLPPIKSLLLEVKHLRKSLSNATPYDTGLMAERLLESNGGIPLAPGQLLLLDFAGANLLLTVKSVEPVGYIPLNAAEFFSVKFFASPDSNVRLAGSVTTQANPNALLQESFKFEDMGIGGLGEEFATLFRRVFSTRLLPAEIAREFGMQHVRGVLLHGTFL